MLSALRLLSALSACCLSATAALPVAGSTGIVIPTTLMEEFVQSTSDLERELNDWKLSSAGQLAKEHGYFLPASSRLRIESSSTATQDEELRRFFLTKQRIAEVQTENPEAEFSTDSPFTLLTDDEFAEFVGRSFHHESHGLLGLAANASETVEEDAASIDLLADSKDWTTSGCVAPVKNQGQCGSCWAFAAIAALESAWCLAGHELTTLSEQQLVSCDSTSYGCQGGFPSDGLKFIQQQGGVCREDDYPYTSGDSGDSGQCDEASNWVGGGSCAPESIAIRQVVSVPKSEAGLLKAVRGQPVAVGVAAGNSTWKQYKSGVITSCTSSQLDHAVLVVGFGGGSGGGTNPAFFKIKNSWGTAWGEQGFIRLKRGVAGAGTCGIIGDKSVYPIV